MKRPKILVADDDRGMRSALKTRLTAWGYTVLEAPDGLGVIRQVIADGIDAIILDHGMPNGNGRSVARMIRRECEAPIIFLSGHDRESFRDTVYALSDAYYLPKPLEPDRLKELLKSCVPSRPVSSVVS
jgi:DNA-binding response OmpR family regulator